MTYKEKVAWLQRYLKAREKANFLGGCVQEMEAEAQGMRTRLDGMPGAGLDTARLARSVEKVEETRKMWNDQLDRCGELRIELVAELAKIQHPLAQEVLRRRYMNGESYAEICDALARGLSARQCAELIGSAPSTIDTYRKRIYEKTKIHKIRHLQLCYALMQMEREQTKQE